MKRYAIVSKKDDVSRHLAVLIKDELKELIYDEEHPDIVISVGGDGTMIYSIHRYEHVLNDVSFVGIHTGTLGFFTDYLKDEYKQLVKDIPWPEHCLIVTLNRGDEEIIARGSTEIHVGVHRL